MSIMKENDEEMNNGNDNEIIVMIIMKIMIMKMK